mmetsp:Transcript_110826/g.203209  ORF Transcript_110826/g.203209 Transcript_110826/m.203209 type:complete len:919 (+) Transcript_110826:61-2817(+)
MATDSDFLDGKWKPTDTCRWKGWLKNVPCCFCTVPCSNSLDVVDGQLTHKAGTLTTRFMPYHGSMRGNFSGTWKEEGCVICLPTPICCPANGHGEMSGVVRNDGTLEISWWDGGLNNERAVWLRTGEALPARRVVVAPRQESMSTPSPQEVGRDYHKLTESEGGFLDRMMRKQQSIRSKGRDEESETPSSSSAFIPNWGRVPDDKLMQHWGGQHRVLPEYKRASEQICLNQEWMSNTKALRHIRQISENFSAELEGIRKNGNAFKDVMSRVIQQAYGLRDGGAALQQKDVISQQPVFDRVKQCYNSLEPWKMPLFIHAWQVILDHERDNGAIVSKLSEVVDRALHCRQVQVQSFQLVLSHSAQLLGSLQSHAGAAATSSTQYDSAGSDFNTALRRFYECFEDFLDDYKERAFSAAFMEPNRFYLTYSGISPGFLKDNVDTHANNWYISLLNAALGVHVPLMATYWDDFPPPACDFWAGLHDEAWQLYFSKPEHFGSSWQGIPGLKRKGGALIRKQVLSGCLPHNLAGNRATVIGATYNVQMKPAKQFANQAVNPKGNVQDRSALALYLERFTTFFRRDRFIRKAFETLNSECKPEHHGFRAAFNILFDVYRKEQGGIPEETYVEHCYQDDMFTTLDIERTSCLFAWLGIMKAGVQTGVQTGEECPICLEMRSDVELLLHASKPKGDVSKHRACALCREQMVQKNQSCPWCRDDMVWQDVFGFLDTLKSDISVAAQPDELADLMGKWQEYEMTRSLPDVRKFASDMIQDIALCAHLDRVLANGNKAFMRDSAGLWCRFHAMVVDKEISVPPAESRRLQRVVQEALAAFEADGGGAPQHVGAMYTQLASALLCASMSGSSTITLVELTKRVGKACVHLHSKRFKNAAGVRERLPKEYVASISDAVWGDAQHDIVLKTFFK